MQIPKVKIQKGFTLMELLVVIFIIGMIMTFAALSVGGGADRAVETEAKRLTALLRLATEESIMNSRDMVMQLARTQYNFLAAGPGGQFAALGEDDPTFRARELPDGLTFKEAVIGGESISLSVAPDEDEEPPAIFIFSSGEMVPFELQITQDSGVTYEVSGDYTGQIDYERVDQ